MRASMDIWRAPGMSKQCGSTDCECLGRLRECGSTEQSTFMFGDVCVSRHVRLEKSVIRTGICPYYTRGNESNAGGINDHRTTVSL